jgi:hypothetical protein
MLMKELDQKGQIVREGVFVLQSSDSHVNAGPEQERYTLLFNDTIVFTKKKPKGKGAYSFKVKLQIPLYECRVILVADDESKYNKTKAMMVILYCSVSECISDIS